MRHVLAAAWVCAAVCCASAQSWLNKEKAPEKAKGFTEEFEAAKKAASAFKQPVFAFFTGSDWRGWCVKLRSEVLDTMEFAKFAADNLILFEADYPREKKQSDSVKKQNESLAAKYGVEVFPTVLLLDAEGKLLAKAGYEPGGAEAYVKLLKGLLEKAGVKTVDKPAAGKPPSAYERMKAEKGAKPSGAAEKK